MPRAIPNGARAKASRSTNQRTLSHRGRWKQREGCEETGEHGDDALFEELLPDDLRDHFHAERVFVSEGLDLMTYAAFQRFGGFAGADDGWRHCEGA
jgi:hypothetical protein